MYAYITYGCCAVIAVGCGFLQVLSLHQKLGKVIPDQSKLLQSSADGKMASATSKNTGFVGVYSIPESCSLM